MPSLDITGLRTPQKGVQLYVRSITDFFTVLITIFLNLSSNWPKPLLYFNPACYVHFLFVAGKKITIFSMQNNRMRIFSL